MKDSKSSEVDLEEWKVDGGQVKRWMMLSIGLSCGKMKSRRERKNDRRKGRKRAWKVVQQL
jgi:hypothetical protein